MIKSQSSLANWFGSANNTAEIFHKFSALNPQIQGFDKKILLKDMKIIRVFKIVLAKVY